MTAVERTVDLAAPPDRVFAMFTDADRLARWLGLSAEVDPRPGGRFRVEVAPGRWCEGVYEVVEPPRRVRVTWGYDDATMGLPPGASTVDVVLRPLHGGTRLTLRHDGLPDDVRPLHADGWGRFLGRLEAVVRGSAPLPHPTETPAERRAALQSSGPARGSQGRPCPPPLPIAVDAGGEIRRPAAEVFAYVADFSHNPEWQSGMRSCRWTTPPPIGVGSTYEQVARFLGRDIVSSFEVVAFDPGRSLTIASRAGTFPITVTRSVEPLGPHRCRVAAHVEGDPGRLFGLAAPLLRPLVARSIARDYRRLRRRLETLRSA